MGPVKFRRNYFDLFNLLRVIYVESFLKLETYSKLSFMGAPIVLVSLVTLFMTILFYELISSIEVSLKFINFLETLNR